MTAAAAGVTWWLQALADIRSDIENTWLERDQSYCWDIRDEYCRNFLEGEMVTGETTPTSGIANLYAL
jgi:hypothetical protein